MKKFFLIIIISLSLSPSLLANKIFLSQFGYSVEIPDDYVKYTRSYLEKNMGYLAKFVFRLLRRGRGAESLRTPPEQSKMTP